MRDQLFFVVVTGLAGVLALAACASESPNAPVRRAGLEGPLALVSPADRERFKQNDSSLGCDAHPARGYGFRLAFDWRDVKDAAGYKIVFWHTGSAIPAVERVVTVSEFAATWCNAFVIDRNLDHWAWRVAALGPSRNGEAPDTLWSETREYGFAPCRIRDTVPCSAPPE